MDDSLREIPGTDQKMWDAISQAQSNRENAPFATLTWLNWFELREEIEQALGHFEGAVAQKQIVPVLKISLGLMEAASKIMLEAYALAVDERLMLQAIPGEVESPVQ